MYYAYEQHTPISQATVVPDGILVGMALQGDERAFESLVDRYYSSLLGYTRHLLNDGEQALDVLQNACSLRESLLLSLSVATAYRACRPGIYSQ
jgi:hypothetical protein